MITQITTSQTLPSAAINPGPYIVQGDKDCNITNPIRISFAQGERLEFASAGDTLDVDYPNACIRLDWNPLNKVWLMTSFSRFRR